MRELILNLTQAILGLACVALSCGWSAAGEPIRVEPVVLRPMQEAEVPAQQTGLLLKILAAEGTQVEAGQILAELDSREARLAVAKAKLEREQAEVRANNQVRVQYAEKSLEVARAELLRSKESIEKFAKSISQSQLDVERLTVEKLMLEKEQAEHELTLERFSSRMKQSELEAAQLRLDQHQMLAPFAGAVTLVRGRVGEWLEVGEPVMRLVAVDRLRAEGFMQAEQASNDLVGNEVLLSIEIAGKQQQIKGVLRFISPEMDPVTGQVRVWAEIINDAGELRPGQQGKLEFSVE